MSTWPASLPQDFNIEGFEEVFPQLTLRTEMDAGPAKLRRRATSGVRSFKTTLSMTQAQVIALDVFYVTTVSSGSLAFDWTSPRSDTPESFRFVTPPKIRPFSSTYWKVDLDLEQLP